ncbi:unnamed protein product [Ilex paraguariensis]|uniref:Histone H4 n=1 Tax=Ilex paraguariensis TaxID=185542 RepID=A0ABC8U7Z2_9AQUA
MVHQSLLSGRGKGGNGLGKGGVKQSWKVLHDNIQGITKLAIFVENVIRDGVTYIEHAGRKTMMAMDVVYALMRQGMTARIWWLGFLSQKSLAIKKMKIGVLLKPQIAFFFFIQSVWRF